MEIKADRAINRVINALRQEGGRRSVITLASERHLRQLAIIHPAETRAMLKAVLGVRQDKAAISRLVIPENLGDVQNRPAFNRLGEQDFVAELVGTEGVFDPRQAKLKLKLGTIEVAKPYRPMALAEYLDILADPASAAELKRDKELGDLFLFKTLLRLRVEVYQAGELRSKLRKEGKEAGDLTELASFVEELSAKFPFGTISERLMWKDKFGIAGLMLRKGNNVAADTVLTALTPRLENSLLQQQRERLSRASRSKEWKVELSKQPDEKGMWIVHQTGYRQSKSGLLRKETTHPVVSTAKLLSMIGHEQDNIQAELERNEAFLDQLRSLRENLPDGFDRLFSLFETFSNYFAWHKEKACVEIEAAMQLQLVGSAQSLRLASDLVSLAGSDLELRQEELQGQLAAMTQLRAAAEKKVSDRLMGFAVQAAKILAQPVNLSDSTQLQPLALRFGGLLGSYFKEEMREGWLKRAKSRLVGARKWAEKYNQKLTEKNLLIISILDEKAAFKHGKTLIIASRETSLPARNIALNTLRQKLEVSLRAKFAQLEQANNDLAASLRRAAEHLLSFEEDRLTANGEKIDREAYLRRYSAQLGPFNRLQRDSVKLLDSQGKPFATVLRREAELLWPSFV